MEDVMPVFKLLTYSILLMTFLSPSAYAQLYGSAYLGDEGLSTLYDINPATAEATPIGPIGFERCGAMDFDTQSQSLFAICERADGSDVEVLVNINPNTGAGTEVGPPNTCGEFTDMSFRNADAVLFASGFDSCDNSFSGYALTTISALNGQGAIIGDMQNSGCCGGALAFSLTDGLFFLDNRDFENILYRVNQSTGLATPDVDVNFPPALELEPRANAMAFNPVTGVLFVSIINGGGRENPVREHFLGTVNTGSGDVTIIGPTVDGLDAIAFRKVLVNNVPTLSEMGLLLMAVVLLSGALLVLARRKKGAAV